MGIALFIAALALFMVPSLLTASTTSRSRVEGWQTMCIFLALSALPTAYFSWNYASRPPAHPSVIIDGLELLVGAAAAALPGIGAVLGWIHGNDTIEARAYRAGRRTLRAMNQQ